MSRSLSIFFKFKPTVEIVKKNYEKKLARVQNMRTGFSKVATYLDSWGQKNFKDEGALTGSTWEELASGGRWVRGKGLDPTAKILQDSGRLKASFQPFASKLNAGIGSDLPYAKTHEEGRGVPKRRMLPIRSEIISKAKAILKTTIARVLRKRSTSMI